MYPYIYIDIHIYIYMYIHIYRRSSVQGRITQTSSQKERMVLSQKEEKVVISNPNSFRLTAEQKAGQTRMTRFGLFLLYL
jgi:hypothetical protein